MDVYKPAMKVLYRNETKKLKALESVQKALMIMNRTAKGVGGGSDTTEKAGVLVKIMGTIAHVPGFKYTGLLVKKGLEKFAKLNEKEISNTMVRLLYDPELATIITKASQKNAPIKKIQSAISRYLERTAITTGETIIGGN